MRYVYKPPGAPRATLGRIDQMSVGEVWREVEDRNKPRSDTLRYLVDEYRKSDHLASLKSRRHIELSLDRLVKTPVNGRDFGSVLVSQITPGVILKYMEYRGVTSAKREIAYLSKAWNWCYSRDIVTKPNPCTGVERPKEPPRKRYISDEEYEAVLSVAPDYIRVAMELAYLCRMRVGEVLDTRVRDIEPEGLAIRRLKGSKDALTVWSDRLRAAVDAGLAGCVRVDDMTIVNIDGSPVKYDAFHKAFKAATKKAGVEDFHFHDLKRKGGSDFEGDKRAALGHRSDAMLHVYDVSRVKVDATD